MTSVVWHHNAQTGAPVLSGTVGSLVGVLDACLVNGFNLVSVSGITVTSNVATLSTGTTHGFVADQVIEVAGATPSGLNGRKRVISATDTTLTFAAPGIADGAATGTLSAKVASAGWEIAFTATNVRVYRSPNVLGTRMFYRVDDTTTTHATITAAESFTDVGNPLNVWMGSQFYSKSTLANATAVEWDLVADDRTVYFRPKSAADNTVQFGFGDYSPTRPNNPYAAFANGLAVSTVRSNSNFQFMGLHNYQNATAPSLQQLTVARDSTYLLSGRSGALGASVAASTNIGTGNSGGHTMMVSGAATQCAYSMASTLITINVFAFPDSAGGGLILSRAFVIGLSERVFYGTLRGYFFSPQPLASVVNTRTIVNGAGPLAGRRILVLDQPRVTTDSAWRLGVASDYGGRVLFDITGPWD